MAELDDIREQLKEVKNVLSGMKKPVEAAKDSIFDLATTFATSKPGIADTLKMTGLPFSSSLSNVAKHLEKQTVMYQQLSRSGIHWGGRMQDASLQAIRAGLTMKQFGGVLETNSELFAAMGASAQKGATDFFANLQSLKLSDMGAELRNLGISYEEQAENMAFISMMEVRTGRRNQMTADERNIATAAFSKNLDLLSKLTGKQAEDLRASMDKKTLEGDIKAFMMDVPEDMKDMVREAFVMADMQGVGGTFANIITKGLLTNEADILKASQMPESTAMAYKIRNTILAGEKTRFETTHAEYMGLVAQDKLRIKSHAIMKDAGDGVTMAAYEVWQDSGLLGDALVGLVNEEKRRLGKERLSRKELGSLIQNHLAGIKAEQDAQKDQVSKGVTGGILTAQEQLINLGGDIQEKAVQRLYDQILTPGVKEFEKMWKSWGVGDNVVKNVHSVSTLFNELGVGGQETGLAIDQQINALKGVILDQTMPSQTRSQAANLVQTLMDAENERKTAIGTGNLGAAETARTNIQQLMANASKITAAYVQQHPAEVARIPGGSGLDALGTDVVKALNYLATSILTWINRSQGSPGIDRAVGNLSSIAESFGSGTPAMLHGNEAVVTKSQLATIDSSFNSLMSRPGTGTIAGAVNTLPSFLQGLSRRGLQEAADSYQGETSMSMEAMEAITKGLREAISSGSKDQFKNMEHALLSLNTLTHRQVDVAAKHLDVGRSLSGDVFES